MSVSLVPSDSYAERAKGAEAAERVLLITNSPLWPLRPLRPLNSPSGPIINLALGKVLFETTETTETKETTAKQSISIIINYPANFVTLVVPVVLFDSL